MFDRFIAYKIQKVAVGIMLSILAQCNPMNQAITQEVYELPGLQSAVVLKKSPPVTFPRVAISAPVDGSEVTRPISLSGTVSSDSKISWKLGYRVVGDSTYIKLASGDNSNSDEVEAIFDPTQMFGGIYEIRLLAKDIYGQSSETTIHVLVTREVDFVFLFRQRVELDCRKNLYDFVQPFDSRDERTWDFEVGWFLSSMEITKNCNFPIYGDLIASHV